MRFLLVATSILMDDVEDLLDEYSTIKKYDYEIEKQQDLLGYEMTLCYINIKTLEELEAFGKDVGCQLVVDMEQRSIEIYDSYRE